MEGSESRNVTIFTFQTWKPPPWLRSAQTDSSSLAIRLFRTSGAQGLAPLPSFLFTRLGIQFCLAYLHEQCRDASMFSSEGAKGGLTAMYLCLITS